MTKDFLSSTKTKKLLVLSACTLAIMVSTAQNAALAQQEGNRLLDGISVPYAVVREYNHTVDLATQSRFEEMEPTIKKLVEQYPAVSILHWQYGRVLMEQGKLAAAFGELEKSVDLKPDRAEPYLHLGNVAARLGKFDDSLNALRTYLRLKPDSSVKALVEAQIKAITRQKNDIASASGKSPPGTYLGLATVSGVRRFTEERMPLKVFIGSGEDLDGYRPACRQILEESFGIWQRESEEIVRFTYVEDAKDADIECHFTNDLSKVPVLVEGGHTIFVDSTGGRVSAEIVILVKGADGKINSDDFLRAISLHEIGHALGIAGHSDSASDIMFASVSHETHNLSSRDIATLKALYKLPPRPLTLHLEDNQRYSLAESSKSKSFKICQEGTELLQKKKDYNGAIKKYRKAIELNPQLKVAFQNLAIALNMQAIESYKGGKDEAALSMFKESIETAENHGTPKELLRKFILNYQIVLKSLGKSDTLAETEKKLKDLDAK